MPRPISFGAACPISEATTPAPSHDFDKAIRLDPGDASAYFNRGVAYFLLGGHFADAEADFKKANELDLKTPISRFGSISRSDATSCRAVWPTTPKQLDMTAWPAPVIRQFLGELTAAQTSPPPLTKIRRSRQAQTCEANFYSGEFALLKKNKPEATRMFKLASKDCPLSSSN